MECSSDDYQRHWNHTVPHCHTLQQTQSIMMECSTLRRFVLCASTWYLCHSTNRRFVEHSIIRYVCCIILQCVAVYAWYACCAPGCRVTIWKGGRHISDLTNSLNGAREGRSGLIKMHCFAVCEWFVDTTRGSAGGGSIAQLELMKIICIAAANYSGLGWIFLARQLILCLNMTATPFFVRNPHTIIFCIACLVGWCCFYYFVRNSLVALLEALCARILFFRFVNVYACS